MNCAECERLFDAYLDGRLGGSLRLEFDAHRLRCQDCQQTLAMLEAVGHVIASDDDVPSLSADFSDRVLRRIAGPQARPIRFRRRWAVAIAAAAQVAAVVTFATVWYTQRDTAEGSAAGRPPAAEAGDYRATPAFQGMRALFLEHVEDYVWNFQNAGRRLTSDLSNLAAYLNITVPEDYVRESVRVADVGANPFIELWEALVPRTEEEPEPAPPADEVHSL